MKKNILLTIGILAAIMLSGCSNFLDVENYGASTTWETQEDVERAVYALWSNV